MIMNLKQSKINIKSTIKWNRNIDTLLTKFLAATGRFLIKHTRRALNERVSRQQKHLLSAILPGKVDLFFPKQKK